jgi:hypothetical protein
MPVLQDYYTLEELASELRVDVRTVQRWNQLRIGPPVTYMGKKPIFRKQSVPAWLASQEREQPRARRRSR